MVIADAGLANETAAAGFIGRIPVRNIWLLMLYASDLFRTSGRTRVDAEHNPDEIADLVAELLAQAVEERQRRQLSLGYRPRSADLSRVRGRIDVLRTERRQLLARGAVACRFMELSVDTPRNRFVRGALEAVARLVARPELRHRCRRLAADMQALGVAGAMPSRAELSADRIGRHDAADQQMLAAAILAMDLVLPTERAGPRPLPMPDREEQWARRLFERAVGGFYRTVLPPVRWHVRTGSCLDWPLDWCSEGAREILPGMQTDIVLDDEVAARRIVIDTKFTGIVTAGWRREATLRSGYLYQVYAYLRSQTGRGDALADHAEGVLLHPTIGEAMDEAISVHGHLIRFATVDLAADGAAFRRQLLKLTGQFEGQTPPDETPAR
ncbi:5-methylcytosine-specific restriction endonuclease system specificity protein McrC [Pseudotabrizicola algicola]|uniref:5-methylcytosine-specific restriction endonuclease system specificity protein McrC n=1 Tax=Pseudotabrizicola algicola TaxID=2709381 RepID=A0A6B3RSA3_9RHOB|nr:5-methylcytosine-specific restriction endonuclease system specificity protein McrC [Pseudotabrizicola algicola]NEX48391.1 5-methylcytosine-specific restriction endonuclease system specificity protein McrC [Pseudotabrizicola algicola]